MAQRGNIGGVTGFLSQQLRSAMFAPACKLTLIVVCGGLVAACSSSSYDPKLGVSASERVVRSGPIPKGGGTYKVGKPYKVAGKWFHPAADPSYDEVGTASWYGSDFHGRRTANGEVFDMNALSAAHPTLPLPTYARVTNVDNGRSVVVRVNDRGPFAHNRLIDLSKRAADTLGFRGNGTADVRVQYVGLASLDGNDEWLTTTVRHDGEPMGTTMLADAGTTDRPAAASAESAATMSSFAALSSTANDVPTPTATPRPGPVPQAPVGGGTRAQPTYAWVTGPGYAPAQNRRSVVGSAFSLFDR